MIFIKGKEPKPLACIQDLAPSETNDSPKAKESPKVNGFVSKICKEAAYERVKALDYFSSSKPSKRNGPILVDACEPKSHWKLSVNASAPATNIRKAMGSASWSHKNLFGGFWGLTGCVAISPHSLKDIQGEVSCSKKMFLGGGRERLSKWLSANKNEFFSIKTEEERRAFERRALKEAFGKQCAITCGGRIEQEDKSDTSKFKKHSVSIFASANVGQVSSFGLDLISYNILAMSKNRSIPELGSDICFRPHVRGWYKAQVGNFNPTEWSAFSWGGSFLTEFMAPIPSPGAHHYKTPKLSTNFLRNSLSAIVRVPLRRLFMGKVGPGLEVFGQCGLLTSLACKRPSEAMENLEEFENNGSVIRTMSLSMIPPNMKCSRPVTAFYSLNTTLGIPCPRFPRLTLAGFFDVGNVARSLRCLFAAGPRATAGLAIRFPIGAGDVELNFGVPLVERKGKDEASRYGISSAFKPF